MHLNLSVGASGIHCSAASLKAKKKATQRRLTPLRNPAFSPLRPPLKYEGARDRKGLATRSMIWSGVCLPCVIFVCHLCHMHSLLVYIIHTSTLAAATFLTSVKHLGSTRSKCMGGAGTLGGPRSVHPKLCPKAAWDGSNDHWFGFVGATRQWWEEQS